jgi:thiol-disulfide isomerase/thioredoxin
MNPHDALERNLAATLDTAAQQVPEEATARLMSGLADSVVVHQHRPRPRRVRVLLLVAAVALIAVVPTAVVTIREQGRAPSAGVASPPAGPGPDAVRLSGQTWDGRDISTSDFLGEPLLVVAWGGWCIPCRTQAAEVGAAGSRAGVTVLGIDVRDTNRDAAGKSEDELGLDFPSIWDASGDVAASVPGAATAYPFTLLVDGRGRVIGRWTGVTDGAELEDTLALAKSIDGAPPLLDGDVLAAAGTLAREQTERLKGVDVTATATVGRGVVRESNIGEPCTSGHVIHIQLAGRFDTVVHGGLPDQPYLPTSGVGITADLVTGEACLLGVSTGQQTPAPGAVVIYTS